MSLERAILLALLAAPRALPAQVILHALPMFTGRAWTLTDLTATLSQLELKGHVKGTGADEDRGPVWIITAEGRLRVA